MLVSKIKTITNIGLDCYEIIVEADMSKSLPTIEIVGLPDAAIKEAKERIRSAFRNTGIETPPERIVLNLSPSNIKKIGTRFDLPMAIAIIVLTQELDDYSEDILSKSIFLGELGLDGKIKKVDGILTSVIYALKKGFKTFFVPSENSYELEYIKGITVYPLENLSQIKQILTDGSQELKPMKHKELDYKNSNKDFDVDLSDVKGHFLAKRAISIAAAGLHNILLIGAPGSGKTMLCRAIQSILPPIDFDEVLEISQIYSITGKLGKSMPLIINRPFRQVHHTASQISIVGGSRNLTPGEVSLSHKGILFLDELAEFPKETLEVLRQPLEDRTITISRVSGSVQYPASFMLVAAMNPCKCGYYKDPEKNCLCGSSNIKRYQSKISGPLLDRIDILLEIPRETTKILLKEQEEETSEIIRERIKIARLMQQARFKDDKIKTNSQISAKNINKYIFLNKECKDFLINITSKLIISPRVVHRTLKLSRTIADLDNKENVEICHIAEAFQYRNKSMFVEN